MRKEDRKWKCIAKNNEVNLDGFGKRRVVDGRRFRRRNLHRWDDLPQFESRHLPGHVVAPYLQSIHHQFVLLLGVIPKQLQVSRKVSSDKQPTRKPSETIRRTSRKARMEIRFHNFATNDKFFAPRRGYRKFLLYSKIYQNDVL